MTDLADLIAAPCPDCGLYGCRKGYSFSIRQGGLTVASGSASKAADAIREFNRYLFAYVADGPVKGGVRHGRKTIARMSLTRTRAQADGRQDPASGSAPKPSSKPSSEP